MIVLKESMPMAFGGIKQPAAYGELVSIGGLNPNHFDASFKLMPLSTVSSLNRTPLSAGRVSASTISLVNS
ncbi:hypothetical protein LguiA_011654 [Lonicera macranthoides]